MQKSSRILVGETLALLPGEEVRAQEKEKWEESPGSRAGEDGSPQDKEGKPDRVPSELTTLPIYFKFVWKEKV